MPVSARWPPAALVVRQKNKRVVNARTPLSMGAVDSCRQGRTRSVRVLAEQRRYAFLHELPGQRRGSVGQIGLIHRVSLRGGPVGGAVPARGVLGLLCGKELRDDRPKRIAIRLNRDLDVRAARHPRKDGKRISHFGDAEGGPPRPRVERGVVHPRRVRRRETGGPKWKVRVSTREWAVR